MWAARKAWALLLSSGPLWSARWTWPASKQPPYHHSLHPARLGQQKKVHATDGSSDQTAPKPLGRCLASHPATQPPQGHCTIPQGMQSVSRSAGAIPPPPLCVCFFQRPNTCVSETSTARPNRPTNLTGHQVGVRQRPLPASQTLAPNARVCTTPSAPSQPATSAGAHISVAWLHRASPAAHTRL